MPGRFRSGYKKRYTASKRSYGRGSNAGRVAAQAARRVIMSMGGGPAVPSLRRGKYIRSGMSTDLNYADYSPAATLCTNSGNMQRLFTPVVQGTSAYTRMGDKIRVRAIDAKITLVSAGAPTASTVTPVTIRIIIGYVKSPGGAGLPPISGTTGILDSSTIATYAYSPYQYDSRERYVIWYDKIHVLSDYDTTLHRSVDGSLPTIKELRFKKNLNAVMTHTANSGLTTDVATFLPFVFYCSDSTVTTFQAFINTRIRFEP